ncbi:MAG: hypothetical protein HZB83_07220 [Deltaproteobacteria bacterium]|nr:hypothetical protein [Deltaproteobacteria bacterium]
MLPFACVALAGLFFFCTYLFFSIADSEDMLNISISLYKLHDPSINVMQNRETGEVISAFSKYGLGLPVFLIPFLFISDILNAFSAGINSNVILSLPNLIILAGVGQTVYLSSLAFGYGRRSGLFLSILSVFGTFLFPYMNYFLSEPLQALSVTLAFLFLYRAKTAETPNPSYVNFALAGISLSYGIFTKAAVLVLLPAFSMYAAFCVKRCRGRRTAAICSWAVPVILFGILTAYSNYSRFGSLFDFGYGEESGMFTNPVASGIYNLLLNPSKGILIFAPVIVLFPYALWEFGKRYRAEALLIAALVISNAIFYSAWWAWEGGESWGPRFLLPLVPLSIVPCGELLGKRAWRAAVRTLFALGFLVNILGTVQDFSGYDYIVFKSTGNIILDTKRPKRDYLDVDGARRVPPYVIASTLPEFNVLTGNLWLLKAKYEGWKNGYGLGRENSAYKNPPWIKKYPGYKPPQIETIPYEIRTRIECPPPLLLSSLICPDRAPSAPYYYDALMHQADKAEALGYKEKALSMRKRALEESHEKRRRILQMR